MAKAMLILLLLLASVAFAQDLAPEWLNEAWRASHYPVAEWYTGFAVDKASGQPDAKAYQSVERDAQGKLSESIVVTVQGNSALQVSSQQTHKGEAISTSYDQSVRTASNAVLAKVDVKSYFDKKSGSIYAFAAVKKSDLAGFYRSNINILFAFADKEFAIAEYLAEQGGKKQALDKVLAIEDSLKSIGSWVSLLGIVGGGNPYAEQEKSLWQKAGSLKTQLRHGTAVYLHVSGEGIGGLGERVGALMQEKGCNCSVAEKEEDADYSVSVKARLGSCSEAGNGLAFCTATAAAVVSNIKLGKPVNVNIPEAKGGWANNNKERAAEEALKKLAGTLADKINQTINQ